MDDITSTSGDQSIDQDLEVFYEKKYRKYQKKIAHLQKTLMRGGQLDEMFCPNNDLITVKFDSMSEPIVNEQIVPLEKVQSKPTISFKHLGDNLYTILMLDPDVPSVSNPIKRHWLHWMKINHSLANDGNEVINFEPSNPPQGSGVHRYYFKIYKQRNPINQNVLPGIERSGFDVDSFITVHHLQLIACIHYKTEQL